MRGSTVLEKYLIFTKYFGSSTSTLDQVQVQVLWINYKYFSFLPIKYSSTDKIVLKYKYKYRYLTTTLTHLKLKFRKLVAVRSLAVASRACTDFKCELPVHVVTWNSAVVQSRIHRYPAMHINSMLYHCHTLQYNHNI